MDDAEEIFNELDKLKNEMDAYNQRSDPFYTDVAGKVVDAFLDYYPDWKTHRAIFLKEMAYDIQEATTDVIEKIDTLKHDSSSVQFTSIAPIQRLTEEEFVAKERANSEEELKRIPEEYHEIKRETNEELLESKVEAYTLHFILYDALVNTVWKHYPEMIHFTGDEIRGLHNDLLDEVFRLKHDLWEVMDKHTDYGIEEE